MIRSVPRNDQKDGGPGVLPEEGGEGEDLPRDRQSAENDNTSEMPGHTTRSYFLSLFFSLAPLCLAHALEALFAFWPGYLFMVSKAFRD